MYCHTHHCHIHHCRCGSNYPTGQVTLTEEELLAYTQEMKEELKDYTVDLKDQIFSYIDIGVNPVEIANTFASLKEQDTFILRTLTHTIDELNNTTNLSMYNLRTRVTDLEGQSATIISDLVDRTQRIDVLENDLSYVNQKTTRKYNSVADMVADTKLKVNQFVEVLGYYAIDDGGGCTYKVVATGTADGGSVIALGNGLFAKAIFNGTYKTSQWGIEDGVDATTTIRKMFDYLATIPEVKKVIFDRQVSAELQTWGESRRVLIRPPSNTVILADKNKPLKLLTRDPSNSHHLVAIRKTTNVLVKSLVVDGAMDRSLTNTGEWGMGFALESTKNTVLLDCHTHNTGGDGFYLGVSLIEPDKGTPNIDTLIEGCSATSSRRQGMSAISFDRLHVNGFVAKDIRGTPPQAGIDIEPNNNGEYCNGVFDNCVLTDTVGIGFEANLSRISSMGDRVNIVVRNLTVDRNFVGVQVANAPVGTTIKFDGIKSSNAQTSAMLFKECSYSETTPSRYEVKGLSVFTADRRGLASDDAVAFGIFNRVKQGGGYVLDPIRSDGSAHKDYYYAALGMKLMHSKLPATNIAHLVLDNTCELVGEYPPAVISLDYPDVYMINPFDYPLNREFIMDSTTPKTKSINLTKPVGTSSVGLFKFYNHSAVVVKINLDTSSGTVVSPTSLTGTGNLVIAPGGFVVVRHRDSRLEFLESSGLSLEPIPEPEPDPETTP